MKKKQSRMTQAERREQIVKMAMKIINEEGYAAFTTRRLADKIGISEPALYRHFANKDEIIISILMKMEELWSGLLTEVDKVSSVEEKICLFIMMHFHYIENNRDILAVLFADEYLRLHEKIRSMMYEVTGKRFTFLLTLLENEIAAGRIRGNNPRALAIIIIGAIRTTALNWRNSGYSYSLSEFGEDICISLTNMMLCDR
jgi:AcrR family transcriptional regulator